MTETYYKHTYNVSLRKLNVIKGRKSLWECVQKCAVIKNGMTKILVYSCIYIYTSINASKHGQKKRNFWTLPNNFNNT